MRTSVTGVTPREERVNFESHYQLSPFATTWIAAVASLNLTLVNFVFAMSQEPEDVKPKLNLNISYEGNRLCLHATGAPSSERHFLRSRDYC